MPESKFIFDIEFDENIFRKQHTLYFKYLWKDALKKNKNNLYAAIIHLVVYLFFIIKFKSASDAIYYFIFMALFFFYMYFNFHFNYKKKKAKFFNILETEITNHNEHKINQFWEFNDSFFRYKDYKFEVKMIWEGFEKYRIIEDNIFLDINPVGSYIIGKTEIGEHEYEKLILFLKEKLQD